MNPYTSSGSVATMTANVSGNDNLNDLGDGPRQPGDPERYPVGAVTRRLLGYVRPHRVLFAASFVSAAISVILQLYTPILIGEGIDLIVATGQVDFDALLPLVTKLALVVVGAAAFQWLQGYCVNRLSYETVRDMRVEASDKLSRMPLSFIDGHAHGDLMSRVVNDVDQVGDGLLQGFTQLFTGVILFHRKAESLQFAFEQFEYRTLLQTVTRQSNNFLKFCEHTLLIYLRHVYLPFYDIN